MVISFPRPDDVGLTRHTHRPRVGETPIYIGLLGNFKMALMTKACAISTTDIFLFSLLQVLWPLKTVVLANCYPKYVP